MSGSLDFAGGEIDVDVRAGETRDGLDGFEGNGKSGELVLRGKGAGLQYNMSLKKRMVENAKLNTPPILLLDLH